ncbi:MAG: helix-turn-helix domain-containing protein, partial [Anaerolineales bacterium]
MTSTRQLILDYLGTKQTGTAPEVARATNMTAANVRHHLSILLDEGVIEAVGEHHTKQRGRPSQLYALSKHTRQHNLDQLSHALLVGLLSDRTPQERTRSLKNIAS